MATVDKNFKVKHGLIVEGTTATVNGEDIITTGNTTDDIAEGTSNLYFTAERAADAVADEISTAVTDAITALDTDAIEEGSTNLYYTTARGEAAVGSVFYNNSPIGPGTGVSVSAYVGPTGPSQISIDRTQVDSWYDAAGAASTAESNANDYTDTALESYTPTSGLDAAVDGYGYLKDADITGLATETYVNSQGFITSSALDGYATESYVGSAISTAASNYDAAGAASTAESNANDYTDTALESYTPTSGLDAAVDGYGYLKSEDLSGYATETYVGTAVSDAIADVVGLAPAALDTLQELAAAFNDEPDTLQNLITEVSGKQDTLTAGSNIDITGDTISVSGLDAADISDFNTAALSATASAYDAAGAASTAEQNAIDYADETFVTLADLPGQLDDYVPTSEKGQALGVATLDASGYVPSSQLNIDVSGDISTAINALTTDDIEEGEANLYFTDARAVDALEAVIPNFTDVDVNSVARQVAGTATISAGATDDFAIAYSWAKNSYKSAKFLVKVIATSSGDSEMSEVLVMVDPSDNVHITEYGILSTNGSLATVSAQRMGGAVLLTVSPTYNSTVKVFGTLLP